jgi:hypothetical protein
MEPSPDVFQTPTKIRDFETGFFLSDLESPGTSTPASASLSVDFLPGVVATTVKKNATILHSRADEVVPFADSEELIANSGLPASALIEVGSEHRLADDESLAKMLEACNG